MQGFALLMPMFESWYAAIQERAVMGTLGFWENLYKEVYINFLYQERYLNYLRGLWLTLEVTFFAALLGFALGLVLAMLRVQAVQSPDGRGRRASSAVMRFLSWLAGKYINIIRGTPMLLQILIINFGIMAAVKNKTLIGIVACGINSAAYVAEILRGGILSVDKGQIEAGRSLGLSRMQTMVMIVFPQALKSALPSLCNEFIALLKETSILAYIALSDLTKAADYIRSRTYSPFMPYIISGLMYLTVVTILTKAVGVLERRLRQSDAGNEAR
ncbi:MAG: amino acid ABC transporter permease [Oscillospiraceae bacterium]|nr:amino acid ABC transporter permease [Oscillospiraceae bacterium]